MIKPIELLNTWLVEEEKAGAPNPRHAVLSTCNQYSIPHARVVAIKEINEKGLLFFTQRGTKKVSELLANPSSTFTFWFELLQREIIIEGTTIPLTDLENEQYWHTYQREAQIRFYTYAPTSSQQIASKKTLEDRKNHITLEFEGKKIPLNPLYCGFRFKPSRMVFYSYLSETLSDVFEYVRINDKWSKQLLSP